MLVSLPSFQRSPASLLSFFCTWGLSACPSHWHMHECEPVTAAGAGRGTGQMGLRVTEERPQLFGFGTFGLGRK